MQTRKQKSCGGSVTQMNVDAQSSPNVTGPPSRCLGCEGTYESTCPACGPMRPAHALHSGCILLTWRIVTALQAATGLDQIWPSITGRTWRPLQYLEIWHILMLIRGAGSNAAVDLAVAATLLANRSLWLKNNKVKCSRSPPGGGSLAPPISRWLWSPL